MPEETKKPEDDENFCCELIAVPAPPVFVIKKGACDPPFYDYSRYVIQPKERSVKIKLKNPEEKSGKEPTSEPEAAKTKEELIAAARAAYKSRYDNYYNNYNKDWRAKSVVYEDEDD